MTISTLQKSINERLDEHYEEMVEIRRHLHMNPELSFQEEETAAFIASYYDTLQIPTHTQVGGHGVLAFIEGASPGPTIALRADFDALPIHDEKDVPYKSTKPGVMHACGHDGHTATLLVLAKVLHTHRDQLKGKIVLIHQHAEEYAPGGAKPMIEDGCLDGVDVIFGTHLWSSEPCGTILYKSGNFMAAADRFSIQVQGKGGHGAQPHLTKDAVLIGSQIVANLQQVVARKVNPIDSAVVSVGGFVAENAFNVIADSAVLTGTARSFEESARHIIEQEIEQVVKGVCQMHDASYTYEYVRGYPAVKNHPKPTEYIADVAEQTEGVTEVKEAETQMGGEDFAYYLQHVPGTFFYTGAMPENSQDVYPHHHPKFDINEKAMPVAAKVLANAVLSYNE
ncbi:M20 family metallopeptidase [Bacillus safensis]|uniref:M20 family metallopeptidase n=1 Tax=Bacillus safensis TaxID=561879 RepID=UPI00228281EE|nr:M20 family metallopeptidase [Bacillus safensis]MCY7710771.1 M20 family metallopeptidase [Bacillus safensis]MCY7727150.1 M20 family metallopeptidase [Bacillus safensis]MED0883976.1 M20 family metallopeptidase [Bacillus safensis]MED0915963.1 M20 family metallopeptidase [Bacillus safensis]